MRIMGVGAVVVALALAAWPGQTFAQSAPVTVSYVQGFSMVGGPTGTDFTAADLVYAYDPSGYTVYTPRRVATACTGYWAEFPNPTTVTLPNSTGPTQTCPLLAGWTLLGNPFSGIAQLPAGVTAYHWNPDEGRYDVVTSIIPGASAWVYSDSASSILLTYVPVQTRAATTLTISDTFTTGPYVLHVGDSLRLIQPLTAPSFVTADDQYLHLEAAGTIGDMSCIGDPSCVLSFYGQFWTYHAIAAGTTFVTVTPQCTRAVPACSAPSRVIEIDILP